MVKLADTQDLGSCAARLAGSNPASPTIFLQMSDDDAADFVLNHRLFCFCIVLLLYCLEASPVL